MLFLKKNMGLLLSILLLTITVAFFGPVELYFTNYDEFWFGFQVAFLVAVMLTAVSIIFFFVLGMLLKENIRDLYGAILFIVGLALYIQGNYANIDYGVLDGKEIAWGEYSIYAILDSTGWLILLVGGAVLWIRRRDLFHQIQKYGSIFIITVQLVTLIVLMFTMKDALVSKSECYLSEEGMYEVSADENIIIFVLDAFEDTYFQEILEEEPDKYQTIFENFIHFNNAVVGGSRTKIGMPAIITGEHYPGEISYTEYIAQSFNRDRLYTKLQQENYDVRFYTEPVFIPDASADLVQNQVSTGYKVSSYTDLTEKYLSLTLYKYMPHVLKRFFWLYTGDFDQYREGNSSKGYMIDDALYYKGLDEEGLQVNSKKNVFRLFHLNGAHPPYTIDEYARTVDSADASQIGQAKGALYIVEKYISQLKDLGVYDSSTIIVMSDHGQNNAAHGILLVKRKNQVKAYTETAAPVSYYDLHATLFEEMGVAGNQSFFDIEEGMSRRRYFYLNMRDVSVLQVAEYVIDGDINYNGLEKTGNILKQSLTDNKKYRCGTVLTFGGNNTALEYIVHGFGTREEGEYSWTNDKSCEFEFELTELPKRDLLLTISTSAVYNENGAQTVICYANGIECGKTSVVGTTKLKFMISKDIVGEDKKLTLRLDLPNATIPKDINSVLRDSQILSLAVKNLCIEYMPPSKELISEYVFGNKGNVDRNILNGWYDSEPGGNWTSDQAEFLLLAKEKSDYEVTVNYHLYNSVSSTDIYVNGSKIATLEGNTDTFTFNVPEELLSESLYQILEFKTENAVSPYILGEGEDRRILGAWIERMNVKPVE